MSVMGPAAHGVGLSWFCRVLVTLPMFLAIQMAWAASPTISSFSPASGPVGTSVTINGANFSSTKTSNTVKFNGTSATVTSASTTKLVVTVPSGATSGAIAVTVSGKTGTSSGDFTVTAPPTISTFSPTSGPIGTSVTITGTKFSATASNDTVKFNGTAATVTSATSTQLVATVPTGATSGKISVAVNGQTATSSSSFTVTTPPTISNFTPSSGSVGTSVTITGSNFSTTKTSNTVKFNGTAATVNSASATQLVVAVPSGATSGSVTVTVSGQTATSGSAFTVTTPAPTISSFSPTSGTVGTTVTINGTNFSSTVANDTVKFNGISATVSTATTAKLTVPVPPGATTGPITVTTGGQTTASSSNFTVTTPAPTISSFTPTNGPVGTTVTITGTNFDPNPTNDMVTFNGTAATTASATSTQLVVSVPSGATTGKIKVTIGSRSATSGANFTPTVSITGFSPSNGPIGTTVTIQGQGFSSTASNNTVTFNGTAATVVSTTTTQLTVTVPAGATTGPITVTTGGKTATSSTSFVVAPQVLGLNPASGPVGTSVTIAGSNFDPTVANDTVSFNGTVAAVTSASATQLIAVVPAGATSGAISVTVAGATTASASSFTVIPAITSFNPSSGGAGTTVTVTGTSFLPVAGQTTVTLNATPVTPNSLTDTQVVFTVPANTATGEIRITTPSGMAVSAGDFVVSPPGIGSIASSVAIVPDGPSQTLSINATNTSAEFTFDAQADHWLTLAVNSLSTTPSNGSITYKFVDPSNQLISQGSLSSSDVTVQVPPILVTGTYQLVFNSANSNSVSIGAALTSDRVLPTTTANGITSSAGGPTQAVGQSLRFTFAANAGDVLGLGVIGLQVSPVDGSSGARRVIVYAPNSTTPFVSGSCFDTIETNGNPIVDCDLNLPALQISGTYNAVVDIGVVGSATWRIEGLNIANNTNTSIPLGSSTNVLIAPGQNGTATFQGNAGEITNLIFTGPQTTSKIYFPAGIVYSPDGTQLTTFNVQLVSSPTYTTETAIPLPPLPLSGTYTLTLEPFEYGGNFNLQLDSASTTNNALIVDGRSNYGITTVAGQALTYTFTGSVGQNLSLGISTLILSPTNGSATIAVTQPNKSQLISTSCVTACVLDLSNLQFDGIYTVTITPAANSTASAVTTLSTDLTGSLSTVADFSGSLTRLGQIAKINFAATAGQTLGLNFVRAEQNATSYGGQW
ncbi:MAG: IPT/TIG domain-containing protein [Proteobacteria bacterium]|nr:IPT/TIG domain-containing protein [Pseudomonadota bacterium]